MIKTKSTLREITQKIAKLQGWDTIPPAIERLIQIEELCVKKGRDTDILRKLSGIASLYGYSDEFCNFLASMTVPSAGPYDIDDTCTHVDVFIESLTSRDPVETVLKIILGYANEPLEIDGPCGMPPDFMAQYEKEQEEKRNTPRVYYAKRGEKEYQRHCNKVGFFRYTDFLKQNHR